MPFAEIALPLPLRQTFFYRVPEHLDGDVRPGVQVHVPFRGATRRGFVVARASESAREDVRELIGLTGAPPISQHLMALARWIADYYVAPLGEVLAATLPGGLEGFARSRARRSATEDPVVPLPLPERFTLTAEQRAAIAEIEGALARGGFAPFLLHGVTASGKTEVYLRGAAAGRGGGGAGAGPRGGSALPPHRARVAPQRDTAQARAARAPDTCARAPCLRSPCGGSGARRGPGRGALARAEGRSGRGSSGASRSS